MDTVKRAAALLDRAKPGWEDLIDTETLSLGSFRNCVLGQAMGGFMSGSMVLLRFDEVGFQDAVGVYGTHQNPFCEWPDTNHTHRWLEEIHDRRSAKTPAPQYIQEGLFA